MSIVAGPARRRVLGPRHRQRANIRATTGRRAPRALQQLVASAHELKNHLTLTTDASFGNDERVGPVLMNGMIVGTGIAQRIAREIFLKSLLLRIQVSNLTDGANALYHIPSYRLVVFLDKNACGSTPTEADLFENTADNFLASTRNVDYEHRYQILYDRVWSPVHVTGIPAAANQAYAVVNVRKIYVKLKMKKTSYDGVGNTPADIESNSLWVFVKPSGPYAAAAVPRYRIDVNAQLRYFD